MLHNESKDTIMAEILLLTLKDEGKQKEICKQPICV